jgi:hypothetical protein
VVVLAQVLAAERGAGGVSSLLSGPSFAYKAPTEKTTESQFLCFLLRKNGPMSPPPPTCGPALFGCSAHVHKPRFRPAAPLPAPLSIAPHLPPAPPLPASAAQIDVPCFTCIDRSWQFLQDPLFLWS